MDDQELKEKIESLNEEQLKHLQVFVDYLVYKAEKMKGGKLRPYGLEKGKIHISDDFDASLKTLKTTCNFYGK